MDVFHSLFLQQTFCKFVEFCCQMAEVKNISCLIECLWFITPPWIPNKTVTENTKHSVIESSVLLGALLRLKGGHCLLSILIIYFWKKLKLFTILKIIHLYTFWYLSFLVISLQKRKGKKESKFTSFLTI